MNIYIHIPFCKTKCPYCGFFSCVKSEIHFEKYFKRLEEEISYYALQYKGTKVDSIYIGGGTPNFVPSKYIVRTVKRIKEMYVMDKQVEISIEVNPEYITKEVINDYVKSGINRVSIGLQSTHNHHLSFLGRRYTYENFLEKLKLVKDSGINNIGVDLIFGFPNLTLEEWKDTLKEVTSLGIQHVSCYSLEIEKDTVFGKLELEKKLNLPTENVDRKMYHYVCKYLENMGFEMYEISNFSKKGIECSHNLNFWNYEDYLGLGAGAFSRIGSIKFSNVENIKEYIKGKVPRKEKITDNTKAIEKKILGLRLKVGIPFDSKYYIEEFMNIRDGRMSLNSKGRDLYNLVVQKIL